MTRSGGFLAAFIIAAMFSGSAWAAGPGGSGQGEISGYAVSAVHFELSAATPTTITAVTFSLEPQPPPAAHVTADIAGQRYECSFPPGAVLCRPSGAGAMLSAADSLTVTAAP